MRRIVVLLLLAASLWFGLPWAKGRLLPSRPPESGDSTSLPSGTSLPLSEVPKQVPLARTEPESPAGALRETAPPAQDSHEGVERLLAALGARDATQAGPAWAFVAQRPAGEAERALRDRVVVALAKAAGETKSAADLLPWVGSGNAFLHSDEGRKVGLEVARRAGFEGATEASALTLTRLLEACMRGPLEKAHQEARATVDAIYAASKVAAQGTVLNPGFLTHARQHKVEKGQVLEAIARKYTREVGVPLESWTLALVNRIPDPRTLRAGTVIKIPVDAVRTVVEKRSFLMAVYLGDVIVRLYWIAHGKDNCTPETTFTIGDKQEKPDWYDSEKGKLIPYGHPENPLGDFFVRFQHESHRGFGAHGTIEPESIGTMASRGCVRMRDEDVREFFRIIPRNSKVEIRASF